MKGLEICGHAIGQEHAPFIIAEAGINHNGEVTKALDMVGAAKRTGANAIKFQTFKANEFIGDSTQTYTYNSQGKEVTESMLAMFSRCELSRHAWFSIKSECDRQGIVFLSTPQNRSDLDLLLEVGISAVKIGSDDFTNIPLLKSYALTGLPLILSCGMADLAEVYRSLECVGALDGYPTVLLLCTSQYPTPLNDVNLSKLATLRTAFPAITLGFSDHTQGSVAASVATAFGAAVFEKHFTLDRNLPGPDHWFSEAPDTLAEWVRSIRAGHAALGSPEIRPTRSELEMRRIARRSVVTLRDVVRGEAFSAANTAIRRPGTGLPPEMLDLVIGGTATRDLHAGEPVVFGDVAR
jgi:sialic acid synthase SpsE